jgi:hypothetical protein
MHRPRIANLLTDNAKIVNLMAFSDHAFGCPGLQFCTVESVRHLEDRVSTRKARESRHSVGISLLERLTRSTTKLPMPDSPSASGFPSRLPWHRARY